jgi:hypothetical protein
MESLHGKRIQMTHDELLIEINRRLDVALYNGDPQIAHALRAVVEVHYEHIGGAEKSVYCYNCQMKYPCQTIQAIEKELE